MRRLGIQQSPLLSTAPALAIVVYDASNNVPQFVLTQECNTDMPLLIVGGQDFEPLSILNDVVVSSSRPSSGGGLRRNAVKLTLQTTNPKGHPFVHSIWGAGLYYGGVNQDSFYFGVFGFDRSNQFSDILSGACYGMFKIDQEVDWTELSGEMSLNLIDVALVEDTFIGATDETIPDLFFYYNSWYNGDFFPKVFGYVPRVRMLNAFPSFNTKQLANTIVGNLHTAYTNVTTAGAVLVLETQVDKSSYLLQLVVLGGLVRIKFADGEVMSGTLAHDTGANTVTFTIVTRKTYYALVKAWMDSKDGKSPDQWGTSPSYSTVELNPNGVIIRDAKNTILDPNGFIQADIEVYDASSITKGRGISNVVTQMQGLINQRKDSVQIKPFVDPANATKVQNINLSTFFSITSNSAIYPAGTVVVWELDQYEFQKFYSTPRNAKLYFINPSTALGGGSAGDPWNVVAVEPASVDYSAYLRNGYFTLDANHVFCEGEGKLIQIPPANVVSVTDSVTAYGLTNLARVTLTGPPLEMNIGAKTNTIYTDAKYPTTFAYSPWVPSVIKAILQQESPFLYSLASTRFKDPSVYTDNLWPYVGVPIYDNQTLTAVIDKLCYQANVVLQWDRGVFDIQYAALYFDNQREVTISAVDYLQPLFTSTDHTEMLENKAQLNIGKLKTVITNGLEHVKLHLKTSFGGWQDPFFANTTNDVNRGLKPESKVISYVFDYINDSTSFTNALGMSLSIGHASGYSTIQKRIITDMSMQGCRWEAMDPIIFKHFPQISDDDSNVTYDVLDNVLYEKPLDGQKFFIMGAVCVIDQVDYYWSVINPHVTVNARMAQIYTNDVSGVTSGGTEPPFPPLGTAPPQPSSDPNTPPNKGGPRDTSHHSGGMNWPMPAIFGPYVAVLINNTADHSQNINITADDGFIYDTGYSYVVNIHNMTPSGISIGGAWTGIFPDKSGTPQPVYTMDLHVDYQWFQTEGPAVTQKSIFAEVIRYFDEADLLNRDSQFYEIVVTRSPLRNIIAS